MLRMNFRTISPQFPHFWHWHRGCSFEQRGVVTYGVFAVLIGKKGLLTYYKIEFDMITGLVLLA